MKAEAGHGGAERIGGVEVVPQDRMSDRLQVQPELMASSGQWRELDPGDRHSRVGGRRGECIVQIAYQYKAKVRLITFESILAFTPESAMRLTGCGVEGMIVGE